MLQRRPCLNVDFGQDRISLFINVDVSALIPQDRLAPCWRREIWRIPLSRRRTLARRVAGRLPTGSRVTMRNCLLRMSDNHEHPVRELAGLCEPVHIGISLPFPIPPIRHFDSLSFTFALLTLSEYLFVGLR